MYVVKKCQKNANVICESSLIFRQGTKVRFPSFLSDGLIKVIVVNPPEDKLAKRTPVQWDTNGNLLLLAILIQLLFAYVSKFKIEP